MFAVVETVIPFIIILLLFNFSMLIVELMEYFTYGNKKLITVLKRISYILLLLLSGCLVLLLK